MKILVSMMFVMMMAVAGFSVEEPTLKEQYNIAKGDLDILRVAICDFINENGSPPVATSLEELLNRDLGNGLSFADLYCSDKKGATVPLRDPWGKPYLYKVHKKGFLLATGGSDGVFKSFEYQGVYLDNADELPGKDVISDNTGFVYFPLDPFQLQQFQMYINGIDQWLVTLM